MSFVNAHFISYFQDLGYRPMVAAASFSLIGIWAIIGTLLFGHLSDKFGRRKFLSAAYHLRGFGFFVVLLSMGIPLLHIPSLGLAALLAGVIMVGISWNAAVGITAAYTSDRFGVGHMGTIYGTMFAVMPLGSGLGAFLGGYFFDAVRELPDGHRHQLGPASGCGHCWCWCGSARPCYRGRRRWRRS